MKTSQVTPSHGAEVSSLAAWHVLAPDDQHSRVTDSAARCLPVRRSAAASASLNPFYPLPQVCYVLEAPPEGWKMGKGRVSKEIVDEHLPLPNEEVMILRCGPPPMNRAVEGLLDKAGYTKEMQFEF